MNTRVGNLLFVVNYPANTGYAWDYFEDLFAKIADRLAERGVRSYVAYPRIDSPPETLDGSVAAPVELDASLTSSESLAATVEFIREYDVRLLYFTDRDTWRWQYAALRAAGAEHVVVSDHTSGARTRPRGVKRAAKWAVSRMPAITADQVVTPSDYVAERQAEVNLTPRDRITRVYYGFSLERDLEEKFLPTREKFDIAQERPIVACTCRAASEKGVAHLLRAFDRVMHESDRYPARPALVYCGDGPELEELRELKSDLTHGEDVTLAGYVPDAVPRLRNAQVFVIPSVWQDALPLSVMEPMAIGKPVVATRVGGIPEMVVDGTTGLLVEPGDPEELARAIRHLLCNPAVARRFGKAARERVASKFSPERELDELVEVVEAGLGIDDD